MVPERHGLEDTRERLLLDPELDVVCLAFPTRKPELFERDVDEVFGAVPVSRFIRDAATVLDGVPVDETSESRVADELAQVLVGLLLVGEPVVRDELVVQLTQGQPKPHRLVLGDDPIRRGDLDLSIGTELFGNERLLHAGLTFR